MLSNQVHGDHRQESAQSSIQLPRKSLVSLLEEKHSHLNFGSTSDESPCWFVLIMSQTLDLVE